MINKTVAFWLGVFVLTFSFLGMMFAIFTKSVPLMAVGSSIAILIGLPLIAYAMGDDDNVKTRTITKKREMTKLNERMKRIDRIGYLRLLTEVLVFIGLYIGFAVLFTIELSWWIQAIINLLLIVLITSHYDIIKMVEGIK